MNELKLIIIKMLDGYREIKNTHYFYHNNDKVEKMLNIINKQKSNFNILLDGIVCSKNQYPHSLIDDLVKYENWLCNLGDYNEDTQINDIEFCCCYCLPQSGYDCVYLNYNDEKPFLTLYDVIYN